MEAVPGSLNLAATASTMQRNFSTTQPTELGIYSAGDESIVCEYAAWADEFLVYEEHGS